MNPTNPRAQPLSGRMWRHRELYLFLLPALLYMIVLCYIPMGGIVIAFKDYKIAGGIWGSQWVGAKHFVRFFGMSKFPTIIRNTVTLSLYSLLAGFPLPIVLALFLNACRGRRFTKVVQTVTYAPHFISTVVIVSMLNVFFAPTYGIVSNVLQRMGLIHSPLMILDSANAFAHLYVWSGVWQTIGWSSIIYLSALTGVDPALHESALIDGANRLQRMIHIELPCIVPTIVVLLILNAGNVMRVGFEKTFLMQKPLNLRTSEVISTYVYKIGLQDMQYSMSTAVDLFNSVINFSLLLLVNGVARRVGDYSLW